MKIISKKIELKFIHDKEKSILMCMQALCKRQKMCMQRYVC